MRCSFIKEGLSFPPFIHSFFFSLSPLSFSLSLSLFLSISANSLRPSIQNTTHNSLNKQTKTLVPKYRHQLHFQATPSSSKRGRNTSKLNHRLFERVDRRGSK